MKLSILFVLALIMNSRLADAACSSIQTYKDVLNCALENNPEIIKSESNSSRTKLNENVASQILNPEINSKTVFSGLQSGSNRDIEITLAQSFELGNKRKFRIERSKAETNLALLQKTKTIEEIYIDTVTNLYRAKYIKNEIEVVSNSLNTFETIEKQYRNRARLSAEQEVSLNIYELAISDYEMKRGSLNAELELIKSELIISVGQEFQLNTKTLPLDKKNWPETNIPISEYSKSISHRLALADIQLSNAAFRIESSLAWPDLKIGPTYQSQVQGSEHSDLWGFSLSLPLPIYHANGAGKSYAIAGVNRANLLLKITETQLQTERKLQAERYKRSVALISALPPEAEIRKKTQKMASLFKRGVVPSSLVVEAERQLLELTKSKQDQEIQAIKSLIRIYAIDGNLLEMEL